MHMQARSFASSTIVLPDVSDQHDPMWVMGKSGTQETNELENALSMDDINIPLVVPQLSTSVVPDSPNVDMFESSMLASDLWDLEQDICSSPSSAYSSCNDLEIADFNKDFPKKKAKPSKRTTSTKMRSQATKMKSSSSTSGSSASSSSATRKQPSNKREPLAEEFSDTEEFKRAWTKWRDDRDHNNQSVKRSRQRAKLRKLEAMRREITVQGNLGSMSEGLQELVVCRMDLQLLVRLVKNRHLSDYDKKRANALIQMYDEDEKSGSPAQA